MPEPYDREGLIDRATDAINGGESTRALEIAEEIRKGEGPNADEALIRGIALSSLGRTAEASDAFAEATRRAPQSHKARFNAAVHEFNAGNVEGARVLANEALALDPAHSATRGLVQKIFEHANPAPEEVEPSPVDVPARTSAPRPWEPQAGDEEEPLPWIGQLGTTWTTIGGVIVVLAFLGFVATTAITLRELSRYEMGGSYEEAIRASRAAMNALQKDPIANAAGHYSNLTGVAAILWTILDLVRRRGNFLWLMGVVPCSCFSFGWLILPLYLLLGRKS